MVARDIAVVLLAYLLGSIPAAHLITRWRTGLRIRDVGEGNVGARNVWHVVGPQWGTLVGLVDVGKGLGAVMLARWLGTSQVAAVLAGPAAIAGHAFPLFLHFQGGKGVATTTGVVLGWAPWSTVIAAALCGGAQWFWRDFNRSIVVGVVAAILLPPVLGYPWPLSVYILVLFCSLALKKRLDLSHERQVWAHSGWQDGALPGWHEETPPEDMSAYRARE